MQLASDAYPFSIHPTDIDMIVVVIIMSYLLCIIIMLKESLAYYTLCVNNYAVDTKGKCFRDHIYSRTS